MRRTYDILTSPLPEKPSIIAKALNLTVEEVVTKTQNNDPYILDYICRTYYVAPFELRMFQRPIHSQEIEDYFKGNITPYYPAEFPKEPLITVFTKEYLNNIKYLAEKHNITTPAQLGYATRRTWLNLYRMHLDLPDIEHLFTIPLI